MNIKFLVMVAVFMIHEGMSETADYMDESLILKARDHRQVYAVFNFSVISPYSKGAAGFHYNLFPRNIGNLVRKYHVAEFHLSMSQGLWRYEAWGYPYFPAPPGAQLWVWFHPSVKDVAAAWRGFANALSGLLCASLNFIGKTETVTPVLSFKPEGYLSGNHRQFLRYAVLPRENLCTENLTPWLKLLPCGSNMGISNLFNPATLHHSQYLSLELSFKYTCAENGCQNMNMALSQSVSVVFDLKRTHGEKRDFSIESVLEKTVKGACPLARSSLIKISVPETFSLHPAPSYSDGEFDVYDLLKIEKMNNIKAKSTESNQNGVEIAPTLVAHCHITGVGQQDGGMRCQITNRASKNLSTIVMQTIPWFLQVYLHSLSITDQEGKSVQKENLTFYPAKIRHSPHFLEYNIDVPAQSTIAISLQFTRGFLTWTEHPPDANHGFYIGSTVITVKSGDIHLKSEGIHRIYTETIQVTIPVPDFSMPYNVICLACTVIAIAFGSLHNLTTRIYQKVDPQEANLSLFARAVGVLNQLMQRLRNRRRPVAE